MNKPYEKLTLEIIRFGAEDIITASAAMPAEAAITLTIPLLRARPERFIMVQRTCATSPIPLRVIRIRTISENTSNGPVIPMKAGISGCLLMETTF